MPVAAENLRNVGVGRNYLLQDVTNNEIYRIKVLNNGNFIKYFTKKLQLME